ncbi:MAG: DUF1326 domain-containing protein [Verrucomicrobia bacterium]|nr:DUF1326 domain-containing protein [Verrucomicrobiota bacterium]
MTSDNKVKWSFEADYLQACSCDYGCPCEFEAPPARGFCQGLGAWKINRGNYGDVLLNGLALAFALHTPEEMHKGNGTGVYFIDEKATPQQRDALQKIATAHDGGMPFEVLKAVITKWLPPQFVPFRFHLNGKNSSVKVGNALTIACEPIKNPVSGEPESVRIVHATGFIFKDAEVVSARECESTVADFAFSWPNKAGFVSQIKYGN